MLFALYWFIQQKNYCCLLSYALLVLLIRVTKSWKEILKVINMTNVLDLFYYERAISKITAWRSVHVGSPLEHALHIVILIFIPFHFSFVPTAEKKKIVIRFSARSGNICPKHNHHENNMRMSYCSRNARDSSLYTSKISFVCQQHNSYE